jgi:hypothetical protein
MKAARPNNTTGTIGHGCGSVCADEILTLREAGRRLNLANRAWCIFQKQGLRVILAGRVKLVLGRDLIAFFDSRMDGQRAGTGGDGPDHALDRAAEERGS